MLIELKFPATLNVCSPDTFPRLCVKNDGMEAIRAPEVYNEEKVMINTDKVLKFNNNFTLL